MSRYIHKKEYTAREQIADSLKLPLDIVAGAAIVTVTGRTQVMVENYKGILEYTEDCITLQSRTCRIFVCGSHLTVAYYTGEDMKIEGNITQIRYE